MPRSASRTVAGLCIISDCFTYTQPNRILISVPYAQFCNKKHKFQFQLLRIYFKKTRNKLGFRHGHGRRSCPGRRGAVVCGGECGYSVVHLRARRLQTLFARAQYDSRVTESNLNLHFASCLVSKGKIHGEGYKYLINKFFVIRKNALNIHLFLILRCANNLYTFQNLF